MTAGLTGLTRQAVHFLHPAYFAMVMATAMVAVSAHLLGLNLVSRSLTWLNIAAFVILSLMTLARAAFYPQALFADLIDHRRGTGFFTLVAGTCVLAGELVRVFGSYGVATAMWFAGILLWIACTYVIFTAYTVKEDKPSLGEGINGGWLLAIVATQSVANLGGLLLPAFAAYHQLILFVSLSFWLCGGMLYIWMISLVFYRYTFFRFSPSDLLPPYWINMGAMAISTLVGTTLIAHASEWVFLDRLSPFLDGFTVLFWATATWWIPMLLILGFWRHVYKKLRLAYDPLYWGAVFPLAMYAVSTFQLAKVMDLPALLIIPRCFAYIALAAWLLTFTGLLHSILSGARQPVGEPA